MKIKFRGKHNTDEVLDSIAAILQLFEEQYGVTDFNNIKFSLTLVNEEGEEVELMDADTSEVFDMLEVHKDESVGEGTVFELEELEPIDDGRLH